VYWGHEIDLLPSRDFIDHVTIWYPYTISYWWPFGTSLYSNVKWRMWRNPAQSINQSM